MLETVGHCVRRIMECAHPRAHPTAVGPRRKDRRLPGTPLSKLHFRKRTCSTRRGVPHGQAESISPATSTGGHRQRPVCLRTQPRQHSEPSRQVLRSRKPIQLLALVATGLEGPQGEEGRHRNQATTRRIRLGLAERHPVGPQLPHLVENRDQHIDVEANWHSATWQVSVRRTGRLAYKTVTVLSTSTDRGLRLAHKRGQTN